jgi:NADPH:quinone reductase-like Zn-dependent oxidoreductase
MKAIVYEKYGPPSEVLRLEEVEKPTPKTGEVLVKTYASSINWADEAAVRGKPYLVRATHGWLKPKNTILGSDIAGRIEAVGEGVKNFQPGDEVFGDMGGHGFGAFAEYTAVSEDSLALKPDNLTYGEAASVPQYAVVALQGLRDKGQIQSGHKVLINGASGGIGTFAVQLAKAFGAEVTGVCSTRNLGMVRSIGADHVIDYTQEDFTLKEQRYDLILDIVTNHSVSENLRALNPTGTYVAVAFSVSALLSRGREGKKAIQLSHEPKVDDLIFVKELIEAGKVVPIVAKIFPLSEAAEAIRHYGEDHPAGKVVLSVEHNSE